MTAIAVRAAVRARVVTRCFLVAASSIGGVATIITAGRLGLGVFCVLFLIAGAGHATGL